MTTETGGETPSPERSWMEAQQNNMEIWEQKIGMIPCRTELPVRDEAHRYMQLASQERRKLSCDECAEACLVLAQWAAHLERVCQREAAAAELLLHRVKDLVGDVVQDAKGFKYEEKLASAIRGNKEAMSLYLQHVGASTKAKSLSYYPARVEKVADAYRNLSNVRRRDRQHGD